MEFSSTWFCKAWKQEAGWFQHVLCVLPSC